MRLYLVQHGDALSKEVDPERALSDAGRDALTRLGAFLKGRIEVSAIVHSGKLRAQQTAELLATALAPGDQVEAISGLSPNDAVEPVIQRLIAVGGHVLVVGHLPFMAKLVTRLLTGSDEAVIVAYRPGTIVCLESEDGAGWQIQWMIRPELLSETADPAS